MKYLASLLCASLLIGCASTRECTTYANGEMKCADDSHYTIRAKIDEGPNRQLLLCDKPLPKSGGCRLVKVKLTEDEL